MTENGLKTPRALLSLSGEDVDNFLQGLVTQNIAALTPDSPQFSALLTPQGKILFDFFAYRDGDEVLIDCAAEAREALAKRLKLYKLRAKVDIAMVEDRFIATGAGAPPTGAFTDPRAPAIGWRAIVREQAEADLDYDARRIACGAPECFTDFAPETVFLLDVNFDALSGVDYKKGCFVGQEVTSRMKRKAEARKRTVIARFDGPAPDKATPIAAGSATVGDVLISAGDNALALVRLDRVQKARDENIPFTAGDATCTLSLPSCLED